jgi:hypothetical protein
MPQGFSCGITLKGCEQSFHAFSQPPVSANLVSANLLDNLPLRG